MSIGKSNSLGFRWTVWQVTDLFDDSLVATFCLNEDAARFAKAQSAAWACDGLTFEVRPAQ